MLLGKRKKSLNARADECWPLLALGEGPAVRRRKFGVLAKEKRGESPSTRSYLQNSWPGEGYGTVAVVEWVDGKRSVTAKKVSRNACIRSWANPGSLCELLGRRRDPANAQAARNQRGQRLPPLQDGRT